MAMMSETASLSSSARGGDKDSKLASPDDVDVGSCDGEVCVAEVFCRGL